MSLPSSVKYYNSKNELIFTYPVNIGWSIDLFSFTRVLKEIPKIYGAVIIDCYGIKLLQRWVFNRHYDHLVAKVFQERQAVEKAKQNLDGHLEHNNFLRFVNRQKLVKQLDEGYKKALAGGFGSAANDNQKIIIQMIRKTMPSLIAHDIVGVQPMSDHVGVFNIKVTKSSRWTKFKHYLKFKAIYLKSFFKYIFR